MNKRERLSELNQLLEKVFDGDGASKAGFLLREKVSLETVTEVAKVFAPKRRERKAKVTL